MAEAHELATHTIDNGGVRLRCVTAGRSGDPMVLLLHGFPARWTTWRRPMPALASAGFFAVAPDLRGYGDSDKPARASAYSLARLVDDVAAIVRGFGRQKVNSVHPIGFEREIRKWSQFKKSWYVERASGTAPAGGSRGRR